MDSIGNIRKTFTYSLKIETALRLTAMAATLHKSRSQLLGEIIDAYYAKNQYSLGQPSRNRSNVVAKFLARLIRQRVASNAAAAKNISEDNGAADD